MKVDTLYPNPDGSTGVINSQEFHSSDDGNKTNNVFSAFGTISREYSVQQYAAQVAHLAKTLKFCEFEKEQ